MVDGKYWTAGGVHCGVDMAAEFMVEKGLCDLEIKRWAQTGAEVVTRGREEDPYAFLLKDVEIPV